MGERGDQLAADISGDDSKGILQGMRAAHGILYESFHRPFKR